MKKRYILDDAISLRGWKKLPYAIYHEKQNKPIFLSKKEFDFLLMCSGKKEIDEETLDDDVRILFEDLKKLQYIRLAEDGETRDLYYKYYDNMYKSNVHWSITGKCNYKCRHCFQSAPCGELMQPGLEECKDIIRQFAKCGISKVGITGGEPLVHPDFLAIVDELIANHIDITVIFSNGKLVTQELLDQLHARGMKPNFQISFDGVGCHDWMRGVDGAEKIALDAIRLLHKNGHGVSAAMVLCKENIGSLRESVKVLAEAGCRSLKTQCAAPQGLWADQKEHFLTYDEIFQAYLDYIPKYAEDQTPLAIQMEGFFIYDSSSKTYSSPSDKSIPSDLGIDVENMPVCEQVHSGFYLGPSGNVVPCMSLDYMELTKEFPNIYEMPLQEILRDSSYTEAMKIRVKDVQQHNEECRDCQYRFKCCAGCRAFATIQHPDDYLSMDSVSCKILKEGWDEKLYTVADQYFKRKNKEYD